MTAEGVFPKVPGDVVYSSEYNAFVPVGVVLPWLKTFGSVDSGTTDSTTADKLVQSGQNFITTVTVGDVIHNTTDTTFAYVTAIDSDTTLSLDSDIMISGEAFIIYKTTALPTGWVECNGQVLSDANSIYNGDTIPDLNNAVAVGLKGRFLRGHTSSGETETPANSAHTHSTPRGDSGAGEGNSYVYGLNSAAIGSIPTTSSGGTESRPYNYSVVFIMRVR